MYPILFKIGWFELRSYGLLLATAFLLGIYLAIRRAKKAGVDPNIIIDLSIVLIVTGLLGARAMYVIFHLEEFSGHWFDIINPFHADGSVGIAGLTVFGGIILSIASALLYLRYKKVSILPIFNIMSPSVALGFAIGRIGCFLNGCCHGIPGSGPFLMVFPPNSVAGSLFPGQPIHPAQLYSSFAGAVNLTLLLLSEKWEFFKDKTFFSLLILYGIARFILDIFRYYEDAMVLMNINNFAVSVNQGISVVLFLTGIAGMVYMARKSNKMAMAVN